jgi:hypothetical protein
MDCDEPHPTPNEKTQPIQWTERPTGALVAASSLWPILLTSLQVPMVCTLPPSLHVDLMTKSYILIHYI